MPDLSLIVATAKNRVIGFNNTLPWHLPEDLKRFKALTMGHHIIMGRKTYESLGRLLPGRTTVIVSRNPDYAVLGAKVAVDIRQAIKLCENDSEIFLIGGAQLYQAGLALASRLYLTEIGADFEGDAFFPKLDFAQWQEVSREQHISQQGLAYSYLIYERIASR